MDLIYWTVRTSNRRREGGGGGVDVEASLLKVASRITLSEYIKVWCNIQVIISQFTFSGMPGIPSKLINLVISMQWKKNNSYQEEEQIVSQTGVYHLDLQIVSETQNEL